MNYVVWALIGMAGYSSTTLFVKLATRDHSLSGFRVLALSVGIVFLSVWATTLVTGGGHVAAWRGLRGANIGWTVAAGVSLAIAVSSLFRALAMGPASVVVPIYGMFIVGGALLGVFFLGEPLPWTKCVGLALAVAGVFLIAR
ncbi:EamA family transporter [Sphingobium sp. WCS2017Hpa-17]|uniref:EamA family transporter n=1 Tax=Sphingobium sp. WCS2017Hpa-17 TaxID=3073638 RepID=UPI00288BD871|nr:EamA family transporter [Sphingobium sp. WCS2017Hpa-17]